MPDVQVIQLSDKILKQRSRRKAPPLSPEKRAKREAEKARQAAVNFEDRPPSCRSCTGFSPSLHGQPHIPSTIRPLNIPWCDRNSFPTNPHSLCDCWVDKETGDVLELA